MQYKVKLELFEGPFELLVYLIEKAEMNIQDIKIAEITSQYIEYIEELQELNLDIASEFLVLAATLLEIKSNFLLPNRENDTEASIMEDPRQTLIDQLLEYKSIKVASKHFKELEESGAKAFFKATEPFEEEKEYLDLDLDEFVKAFNLFLQKKENVAMMANRYTEVKKEKVTVSIKITEIKKALLKQSKIKFEALFSEDTSRYEIIISFIAILEMLKQAAIKVKQSRVFGEIVLMSVEEGKNG